MDALTNFTKKVVLREARVGVIGLGYVGLPLALGYSESGFRVVGFDIDEEKVRMLSEGQSYISYISADRVKKAVSEGFFHPTVDFSMLSQIDAIIVCVPTPLGEHQEPDLSYVLTTARTISAYLGRGQLVVLESTTYPGTTEEEMLPILEESGLTVGEDFFVAYSPEREDPGNRMFSQRQIPKLISGVTPRCLKAIEALYSNVFEKTVPVSSPKVAESAKLLENIYRAVNIALVNEMKVILDRMGIDVWEVIEAASTKPFGFTPFYPGPGLGGHCIPIDPFYLAWKARGYDTPTRFIELAGEINTQMPYRVVSKVIDGLNMHRKSLNGSSVLVLGLAYKEDVDDTRESPALKIISILKEKGAKVEYNDPLVPRVSGLRHYPDFTMESTPIESGTLERFDCTVIVTAHSAYNWQEIVDRSKLIIDTRNATKNVTRGREKIIKA